MDQPNRINPMAFTLTGKRQTPKNEFGQVLATTLKSIVQTGAGIVGSLPGVPAISAAVNAVSGVISSNPAAHVAQSAATGVTNLNLGTTTGGSIGSLAPTGGAHADRAAYSDPQVREMAAMSDYYLKMQNEMQRESREYNAVSNIIKVRHDSAKAAINNIR